MAPQSSCTQSNDCDALGCRSTDWARDQNPRTCADLISEVDALIGAAEDALAEACALRDILASEEPTPEVRDAADQLAVTLFLGRRALDSAIYTLSRRPIYMPALLGGVRTVTELDTACRALVDALLDEITRSAA